MDEIIWYFCITGGSTVDVIKASETLWDFSSILIRFWLVILFWQSDSFSVYSFFKIMSINQHESIYTLHGYFWLSAKWILIFWDESLNMLKHLCWHLFLQPFIWFSWQYLALLCRMIFFFKPFLHSFGDWVHKVSDHCCNPWDVFLCMVCFTETLAS